MNKQMLGKRIREERLHLNTTQESLAENVDLTTAYIGQIERGERTPTLDNLIKIANRLGVTVDYLISDSLSATNDTISIEISQLLDNRTIAEKELAVSILKSVLVHLDIDSGGTEDKN